MTFNNLLERMLVKKGMMMDDDETTTETVPDPGKICDICNKNMRQGIHIRIDNEFGSRCVDLEALAERVTKLEKSEFQIKW